MSDKHGIYYLITWAKMINKTKKRIQTTIYITPEDHEDLRELAFISKLSMAELIRTALRQLFEKAKGVRDV